MRASGPAQAQSAACSGVCGDGAMCNRKDGIGIVVTARILGAIGDRRRAPPVSATHVIVGQMWMWGSTLKSRFPLSMTMPVPPAPPMPAITVLDWSFVTEFDWYACVSASIEE